MEAKLGRANTINKFYYSPTSSMATLSVWTVGLQDAQASIQISLKPSTLSAVALLGDCWGEKIVRQGAHVKISE